MARGALADAAIRTGVYPGRLQAPRRLRPKLALALLLVVAAVTSAVTAPARAAAQTVTVRADRIIDGRGRVYKDARIVIRGSRIAGIDHGRPATYDLAGMTVLPGLIDLHDHIAWYFNRRGRLHTARDGDTPVQSMLSAAANAYRTLMAGFTTIQSPGAFEDRDLRDWIAHGGVPGPRIITSLQPLTNFHLSADSLRVLVRQRSAQGADFIKIFASASGRSGGAQTMSDAQLEAMCGEARVLGLRTLVHAHSDTAVRAAVEAGCTEIEHGLFVKDSTLRLMARRGTYYDPQCGLVDHNYITNWPHFAGIGNYDAAGLAATRRHVALHHALYRRALRTAGLKVVYGTDAVAGAHGHNAEDLICLVHIVGESPMRAIEEATSLAAESVGLEMRIGAIEPGLQADIIAVPGNPLDDITVLRHVLFVMKGGRVYRNVRLRP